MKHHGRGAAPALSCLGVSRETEERLHKFVEILTRWNQRINLVATSDPADLWSRHLLDSLQLLPLLAATDAGPLVDIGSGGGFPGLVLAAGMERPTHLVESDKRKAAFLAEAARHLGLSHVEVHPVRIEAARLPPAAVVTSRAFAPLPDLLPLAHRLLAPGGMALFPKGRTVDVELTAASEGWTMQVDRIPSRTDPAGTILRLSEIRPAGTDA